VTKFKCNGCSRNTELLWLEWADMPDGFKVYQCRDCGCVGVKNIAEQKDAPKDSKVSRCKSCGAWQFDALPCHSCLLIGAYDDRE
jgi:ribosomal protein L32